jgi:serine/threonine-protein kinase RsbW
MGQEPSNRRDKLTIPNDPKRLGTVREFVSRMVLASGLGRAEENKLILAVDEAVTNVMEHCYGPGCEGIIEIEIECTDEAFEIRIRDQGRFFNPELVPNPDVMDNLRTGKKKGLGIFLMRQIMDEIKYRFLDDRRNELVLVKRIKPPGP